MEESTFDLITFISGIPIIGEYMGVIGAVVLLASTIIGLTKTPKEGTWQSKIYFIIEKAAGSFGKAKNKGD